MSTTTTAPRKLPADVYDFLELSALAYGGIGAGAYYSLSFDPECEGSETGEKVPFCIVGHIMYTGDDQTFAAGRAALRGVELSEQRNDRAVQKINNRKGQHPTSRVSFEEWCAELGITRGAA